MLKRLDDEFVEESEEIEGVSVAPSNNNSESELTAQVEPVQVEPNVVESAVVESVESVAVESAEELDAETDEEEFEESRFAAWLDNDKQAFLVSLMVHVVLILAFAAVPWVVDSMPSSITFDAAEVVEPEDEANIIDQVAISDEMPEEIGANGTEDAGMALSTAPILAELSEVPAPSPNMPVMNVTVGMSSMQQAVGLVRSDTVVQGMTGVGTTGTDGAVDRITYEILKAMEDRPTLVVWFFDQSGSLQRRRQEIRDRFDRIYEELGIIRAAKGEDDAGKPAGEEPLLTSVIAFGNEVSLLTKKPTADISEIREAIDSITIDPSGEEKIFHSLYLALDRYKSYRTGSNTRNVLFIAVTDERGSDIEGLDKTIKECRKYAIPVHVIGVPAPFGREVTYVKYVDPDPKYDQTPQWAEVDQGPESLLPERVKIGYKEDFYDEPVIDSGFGPYALSRLTYETGGIYFTVHPNRQFNRRIKKAEIDPFASNLEYFFDPEVMVKYRPDYESIEQYKKKVLESPVRMAVVNAAKIRVGTLEKPTTRFVKRDEASLQTALTVAQQQAARLEDEFKVLAQILVPAEPHREKESSLRWIAGYDLALGTLLAHKVRADGYNAMLAKAKRGMPFEDPKNNTWQLVPDSSITVGSKLEKEGATAVKLLKEVAEKHKGTPWGLLASRELENPIGWKWVEEFTDLNPPPRQMARNNPVNPPPAAAQDDKARMLKPPPPKRPLPKL